MQLITKFFNIAGNESLQLSKKDFRIGSIIAIILSAFWWYMSSGMSLIATFIPGIAFTWLLFSIMHFNKIELPARNAFLPLYFVALAWQCIHFAEEFSTGFAVLFPKIYNGQPYTDATFVSFNMISYFVFILAPIMVYFKGLKFLFLPVLFFIVYGAMGNAIAHVWWAIITGHYFPGLYTALGYWFLGPVLLAMILRSSKKAGIYITGLAIVLVLSLTLLMQ
jgi:hypothetical protein